jgi:metallophosphoesterase superfamily enzyme
MAGQAVTATALVALVTGHDHPATEYRPPLGADVFLGAALSPACW